LTADRRTDGWKAVVLAQSGAQHLLLDQHRHSGLRQPDASPHLGLQALSADR
jgi:hypothetical protein